jgi:hypothetical protein
MEPEAAEFLAEESWGGAAVACATGVRVCLSLSDDFHGYNID